jgi:methionyl-tRNA formyltransferase
MNVYVLCTLETGFESIKYIKSNIEIKGIIGLSKRIKNELISGYSDMGKFCRLIDTEFVSIEEYTLKNDKDKKKIQELDIDILLVLGWQRLIPMWLIKQCKITAIGSHGSPFGISAGRGRSPQNWALILGKKQFEISIFKIEEGIDSGDIINSEKFSLTIHDDIETSYLKSTMIEAKMIVESIKNGKINKSLVPQNSSAKYFPQRKPEDGEIDWSRNSNEIYDFVRALTHPYPGAFSMYKKQKIYFWKVKPIKIMKIFDKEKPGTIIRIFDNGKMLIKTGNSCLLVEEYTHEKGLRLGEKTKLKSVDFKKQMKKIIDRHYKKYPKNRIHDEILSLSK